MKDNGRVADDRTEERPSSSSAGMDQGLRVLSYLISGVLFYGGLGWVGDHFLGTAFLLPVGILAGAAGGIYVIIKRFGEEALAPSTPAADRVRPASTQGWRPTSGTGRYRRAIARKAEHRARSNDSHSSSTTEGVR